MSKNSQCPPIPAELLQWLQEQYPERHPDINITERELWAEVGERRLIRGLSRIFEEQTDNILTEDVLNVHENEGT